MHNKREIEVLPYLLYEMKYFIDKKYLGCLKRENLYEITKIMIKKGIGFIMIGCKKLDGRKHLLILKNNHKFKNPGWPLSSLFLLKERY